MTELPQGGKILVYNDTEWLVERDTPNVSHLYRVLKQLAAERTPYQSIEIFNLAEFGRSLVIDGVVQSTELDEKIYHETIVHTAGCALAQPPERVLIIGGGDGATLREVLRYPSVREVVLIEIDRKVIELTQELMPFMWDGVGQDPRAKIIIDDAFESLRSGHGLFDIIVADITDPPMDADVDEWASLGLYSHEFIDLLKSHLGNEGILTFQAQELTHKNFSAHLRVASLVKKHFRNYSVCRQYIPSFGEMHSFIVASRTEGLDVGNLTKEVIDARIAERISGGLTEYSGDLHRAMFTLPPKIQRELNQGELW